MSRKDPEARKRWQREYVLKQLELDKKDFRERRRKSNKEYRSKPENKAKIKAHSKIYYQKHRRELANSLRERRNKNPEKVKAQDRRYRERHPEKVKEMCRSWRARNREQVLEYRERTRDRKNRRLREVYHTDIEENRRKHREENLKIKKEVLSHYSDGKLKCAKCNAAGIYFLTIDHIHGRKTVGHSRLMKGLKLYYFLRRRNFPKGYQTLCWTCNWIKGLKTPRRLSMSMSKSAIRSRVLLRRYKIEVLSHYSKGVPKCACCGFLDLNGLSIDHIEARKKVKHRKGITSLNLYTWLRNNGFPKGYQVLCISCNSAKSDNGVCPHQQTH